MKPIFIFKKKSLFQFVFIVTTIIAFCSSANAQIYEWAKRTGGTGNDLGRSVSVDQSGNVYHAGYFNGTVDFDPGAGTTNLVSSGSNDAFIAKYDASGNYIWTFKIGGTGNESGNFITADSSGNIYVAGSFQNTVDFDPSTGTASLTAAGTQTGFIAKYDSSGNYKWCFRIGGTGNSSVGSITVSHSGKLLISGSFQNTVDFDPDTSTINLISSGMGDGFVAKYDTAGNYLWAFKIGGTNDGGAGRITEDSLGNLFLVGYFKGTIDLDPDTGTASFLAAGGGYDAFLAEYDSTGNYILAFSIGSTYNDFFSGVVLDGFGNMYLGGSFNGTVDFDPGTNTAYLTSSGGTSVTDIFLAKYDPLGNFIWAFNIGGIYYDEVACIQNDAEGNVYISGDFENTVDFDPGPGNVTYTTGGNYIAKYDSAGNFIWVIPNQGTGYNICFSIALDASGNIYGTGCLNSTVDFDPGPNTANLVSASASTSDIFLAKYSPCKDPLIIAPTLNSLACANDTTLLILNASGTGLGYQWEVDEGTGFSAISNTFPYSGVTSDTLIITPFAGMNGYHYRCILTGSCNPVATIFSDTILLTINPTFLFSNNVSICSGDSALIFGIFHSTAGNYYDSLQSSFGCDSVYEVMLTVDPVYTFNDTVAICDGDSAFVDGAYQFTSGTYYDSYFTLTGCDSVYITELIVKPLPDANIGPDTLWVCNGQLLGFGIDTMNQGILSYSIGNSQTLVYDDSLIFTYNTSNPAPYVIAEVDGINGCSSSDFVKLMNNMIGSVQIGPMIANNQFITFSTNIPAMVDSFFWDFGDGTTLAGNETPTHEFTSNGVYQVCLTAINECETDSDCISISINVGIEEQALQNIIIAPNPVKDIVYISNIGTETGIIIYNALGEIVFKENCYEDISIDLSAHNSGVFFVELKSKVSYRKERFVKID